MPNLSLYKKILFSTSIIISFLIISTLFVLNFNLKRVISGKIEKDLKQAKIIFMNFLDSRFNTLFLNSRIIAESPHLKSIVATAGIDHETVIFALRELHEIIKSDLLTITDSRGVVLARIDEPSKYADDISAEFYVRNALKGDETAAFLLKGNKIYQLVVLPIVLNNIVEGSLVAGFVVDNQIAGSIKEMTGCEVAFIGDSRFTAFSDDKKDKQDFEYLIQHYPEVLNHARISKREKGPFALLLSSDRHLVIIFPANEKTEGGDILCVIQKSLSEAMGFYYKNIQSIIIFISVLAILISILFSSAVAHGISSPVLKLSDAALAITRGEFPAEVVVKSKDEIGILGSAFNHMLKDLKERQETIRKNNEELLKWNRLLEERVEERTRELKNAQAQIVQTAKMAAVGQLAGGVAHEINNPLTGVLNNVQLIKSEIEEKKDYSVTEFEDILKVIEDSAMRCKRIVKALLDFSRSGGGEYAPSDINAALEDTFILTEYDLKLNKINILRSFSPDLPRVMADYNQLQQVFLDIFNNAKWALKAKKEGAELKVKTILSQDSRSVIIEISDNGCGIEKEVLHHIFEPFFSTKDAGEGKGLGLSICYEIIKKHGGTIEAESEGNDKGAVFKIKLPSV